MVLTLHLVRFNFLEHLFWNTVYTLKACSKCSKIRQNGTLSQYPHVVSHLSHSQKYWLNFEG